MFAGTCQVLIYDVNGDDKPNVEGKDQFRFHICNESSTSGNKYFLTGDDGINASSSREYILSRCKSFSYTCSSLIEYDGWQIKDDYPWF